VLTTDFPLQSTFLHHSPLSVPHHFSHGVSLDNGNFQSISAILQNWMRPTALHNIRCWSENKNILMSRLINHSVKGLPLKFTKVHTIYLSRCKTFLPILLAAAATIDSVIPKQEMIHYKMHLKIFSHTYLQTYVTPDRCLW